MSPVPKRTPEERQQALTQALEARKARAEFKHEIAAGSRSATNTLDEGHRGATDELGQHARIIGRMEVGDVLLAVEGIGPVKAGEMLADAGIADGEERLDQLNAKQVAKLKESLAGR